MGLLWFRIDVIIDGDGMCAPTCFRVSGVEISRYGTTLFLSAVDGVADSIVGSSKFKGVHGLSFSS